MTQTGILSFGAYVPKRRLQRTAIHAFNGWFAGGLRGLAKGEKAVANWDEDAITMGVEAARDCLTGMPRADVARVTLASTTLPFADRLNAGIVKEALALEDATGANDAAGSLRAGTSALIQALDGQVTQLVIASDNRKAKPASEAEMNYGDAAAAVLVGQGDVIARYLGGHCLTVDFVDHFRGTGVDFDYAWESRWIRDEGYAAILGKALKDGLAKLCIDGEAIDHAIIAVPVKGVPEQLARKAGIKPEACADVLMAVAGDSGAAHPLVMLAATLEKAKPGEKILLASFGQGADVLVFEATAALAALPPRWGVSGHLAFRQDDSNYGRYLFHRGLLPLEKGIRAEMDQKQPGTTLFRHRKAVLGLIGGRCTKTGTVQFPKSEISVNPNDRAQGTQENYPLAERRAKVIAFTADNLTFSPDPPSFYGTIDFEGGGRLVTEFADVTADEVEVGVEMRMVFRIKAMDDLRSFTKYFWKAIPVSKGDA